MKIISFSQQGPRAICILSANGVISSVTLRQPDSSGGTLTYEVMHRTETCIHIYVYAESFWIYALFLFFVWSRKELNNKKFKKNQN